MLSVSADSPSDAWAVGWHIVGAAEAVKSLTLHWNGSRWTRVPSPNPGDGSSAPLHGVSAVSSRDAWAVGSYFTGRTGKVLILHWDGSRWTQVPGHMPGGDIALSGVSAISGRDAWAVGEVGTDTLVLHWNGTSWAHVASPSPRHLSALASVSAESGSDAWAVGCGCYGRGGHTLVLHWNGTRWVRS